MEANCRREWWKGDG